MPDQTLIDIQDKNQKMFINQLYLENFIQKYLK